MKDLPYWRGLIYNAKSPLVLKSIGEELAQFQSQSDFLGGDPKLNEAQLATLRTQYSQKMKEFKPPDLPPVAAALEVQPPQEPEESVLAKTCVRCGNPIPVERLEAVPTTVRCISCQQKAETGEEQKIEATKCKKCGSVMVWRMTKNLRPAKYFLGCSKYPKCTYIGVSSF
jgi:predicted RNA-binding Zn-ribbon protein involved in translation (DUF1610 family)